MLDGAWELVSGWRGNWGQLRIRTGIQSCSLGQKNKRMILGPRTKKARRCGLVATCAVCECFLLVRCCCHISNFIAKGQGMN